MTARSVWLRLGVCALTLIAVDQAVRPALDRAERRRYDSGRAVRFGSSDLFLIGPLTEYLREHPAGSRPRVAFFGNSTIWGYSLPEEDTVPAMFQHLAPRTQVINFGTNGFQSGGAYLITKAVADSIDVAYVFYQGVRAHPMLAKLIPVSPEDVVRFELEPPRPPGLADRIAGRWQLARYSYRLQGGWFGMSARQCLYVHKTDWIKSLFGRPVSAHPALLDRPDAPVEAATWQAEKAGRPPSAEEAKRVAARYSLLWDFAQVMIRHRKHGVFIECEFEDSVRPMSESDRALLNALFAPHVVVARLWIPKSWIYDNQHLNRAGAKALAELLHAQTADACGLPRG